MALKGVQNTHDSSTA